MGTFKMDFTNVPDVQQPLAAGIYTGRVEIAPALVPNKKGTGTNLEIHFEIVDPPDAAGKKIRDWIALGYDFGEVAAKRFFKGCGLDVDGGEIEIDLDELIGKQCQFSVTNSTGKDSDGVVIERANIKQYMFGD